MAYVCTYTNPHIQTYINPHIDMFISIQIIKRLGEGITGTDDARHLDEGMCNLHRLILIPKKCVSKKVSTMCHKTLYSQEDALLTLYRHPTHTLQTPDSHFSKASLPRTRPTHTLQMPWSHEDALLIIIGAPNL